MRKKATVDPDRGDDSVQDEPGTVETPPVCDCPALESSHRHWPDGPRAIADDDKPADPA